MMAVTPDESVWPRKSPKSTQLQLHPPGRQYARVRLVEMERLTEEARQPGGRERVKQESKAGK